jgi:hypothetical protein
MAAFSILTRTHRYGLLWNTTDHAVQLARISDVADRPVLVDKLTEVAPNDDDAIAAWVDDAFGDHGTGYLPAYCGFHPAERALLRHNINTRNLADPTFLPGLLAEQAKVPALKNWQVCALNPLDGDQITATMPSRPGLVLGVPEAAARDVQQRLRKLRIRPRRLEIGSIALLGALTRHLHDVAFPHAVVVCEISYAHTRTYFLAKDGVHTPATLPHGLLSIEEAAMKELSVPDVAAARQRLLTGSDEVRAHSRRLVRMLTRHLKPAVDYFEMQTGQPIGGMFCAHLPERLGWLEEALGAAIDLPLIVPDLFTWLPSIGVKLAEGAPLPARGWFQPLSLLGQLAPPNSDEAKS